MLSIFIHEYVTGGGLAGSPLPKSLAAEGAAMRRALAVDFASLPDCRVVMTLDDRHEEGPGDWTLVRVGPGEESGTFAKLAAASDRTLCVAPETSGLLRERAETIERVGGRSLGASPEAIALTSDKLRLAEHLRDRGLATPATYAHDRVPAGLRFPAVVKPIDGAGCLETRFVESARDLADLIRPGFLVQSFVFGRPISVSMLVRRGAATWMDTAAQDLVCEGGLLSYRGGTTPIDHPGAALRLAERAVRSIDGLNGWVGVDMVLADDGPVVIEINPRLTTSYIGLRHRYRVGALAAAWLAGTTPIADPSCRVDFDASGHLSVKRGEP